MWTGTRKVLALAVALVAIGGTVALLPAAARQVDCGTPTTPVTGESEGVDGTTGNDSVPASAGSDAIVVFAGNDCVEGGTGADVISGGDGDDKIDGGDSGDQLSGGDGDDTLEGGANDDTLNGGPGADKLDGGSGNDYIVTGNSNVRDTQIEGGAGDDVIDAGGFGEAEDFKVTVDGDVTTGGLSRVPQARSSAAVTTVNCGSGKDIVVLDVDKYTAASNCELALYIKKPG